MRPFSFSAINSDSTIHQRKKSGISINFTATQIQLIGNMPKSIQSIRMIHPRPSISFSELIIDIRRADSIRQVSRKIASNPALITHHCCTAGQHFIQIAHEKIGNRNTRRFYSIDTPIKCNKMKQLKLKD